jgi:GMP synthase (glutamine-hydrolysing)
MNTQHNWPGCNLTIYDDDPRVHNTFGYARVVMKRAYRKSEVAGVTISKLCAGGKVEPHPKGREMGIATKIHLTEEGKKHPMFKGKPEVYSHFVSHDDYVSKLAEGGVLLAGNDLESCASM